MLAKSLLKIIFLVVVGFMLTSNIKAQAIFSVNTTVDSVDSNVGNGICADSSGNCSLRAATMEIDSIPQPSGGQINIPPGIYTLTIPITVPIVDIAMGDLNVNGRSVSFLGTNARTTIIQGNGGDRVFGFRGNSLNTTQIVMSGLTIRNGSTLASGGGINAVTNLSLSLNNVTIANNSANQGGGIFTSGVRMDLTNSTVSGNQSASQGAITLTSNLVFATGAVITNSTISGNSSGIFSNSNAGCNIINSTIANNKNTTGFNGIDISALSSFSLRNTIVVNNFSGALLDQPTDVRGSFDSRGTNLVSGGWTLGLGWNASDLLNNFNSNLGPLADNGGQTDTHAIGSTSAALNAGQNCVVDATCVGINFPPLPTDQRGLTRLVDGFSPQVLRVDIGAYERQAPTAANASINGRVSTSWTWNTQCRRFFNQTKRRKSNRHQ
jgi:hypothetical protein